MVEYRVPWNIDRHFFNEVGTQDSIGCLKGCQVSQLIGECILVQVC